MNLTWWSEERKWWKMILTFPAWLIGRMAGWWSRMVICESEKHHLNPHEMTLSDKNLPSMSEILSTSNVSSPGRCASIPKRGQRCRGSSTLTRQVSGWRDLWDTCRLCSCFRGCRVLRTQRRCGAFIAKASKRWRREDLKVHIRWQDSFSLASHIIFFFPRQDEILHAVDQEGEVWKKIRSSGYRDGGRAARFYGWAREYSFRNTLWKHESQTYLFSSSVWVLL